MEAQRRKSRRESDGVKAPAPGLADCQLPGNSPAGLHREAAPAVHDFRARWFGHGPLPYLGGKGLDPDGRAVSKHVGVSVTQGVAGGAACRVPVDTQRPSARLGDLKGACFREVLRSPAHSPRTGVQVYGGEIMPRNQPVIPLLNDASSQRECFFFTGTRSRDFPSHEEFVGLENAARSFTTVRAARVLLSRSASRRLPEGGPVNEETLT